MNYSICKLYGLKRKRDLNRLLGIKVKNNNNYNLLYKPYIDKEPKKRLIEAPNYNLKQIQKKIKYYLDKMDYPENVFSGIKGRSYIDNALYHINSDYFLKIDLSKFFPNTNREKIFNFYNKKLCLKSDIAAILTDLSSVDIKDMMSIEVKSFIEENNIKYTNHLPSGSPISSILSYLVNVDMFDELDRLAKNNNCLISFYIDDIIFSSNKKIPKFIENKSKKIISKYGEIVNIDKTKYYGPNDYKKITGCVIKDNKLFIPNKTRYKILKKVKFNDYSIEDKNSILGLIKNAQLFDNNKYVDLEYKIKNKL